jgi:drug/metabolite transporter (DMT)-like permease
MPASHSEPEFGAHGRRTRGYGLAVLAAACWATGGLTAKWLFTASETVPTSWRVQPLGIQIDPAALSGGRALAAFLLLGAYLLAVDRRELAASKRELPFLLLFGVVGLAAVHYSYFKTISLTNVATAILLEYLAPVIVLIVSVLFLGKRLTWALPIGVTLSVVGCALVVGALGGAGLVVSTAGITWGLLSAAFFASYSLMGTYAAGRFSPWKLLFWGLGFASAFWLIVLGPRTVLGVFSTGAAALAVVYVAVMSTIVPFGAFLKALHYIEPTQATVTATLEPVLAGLGAFLLFGEVLTVAQLLGGVMVIGAIFVVQRSREAPGSLPPQD